MEMGGEGGGGGGGDSRNENREICPKYAISVYV